MKITTLQLIGEQILQAKIKKNISVTELCLQSGIQRHQYYSVIEARTNYTIDTLTKLVEKLEIENLKTK